MSSNVKFPQRAKVRANGEECTVLGVKRNAGIRLYVLEFKDGETLDWLPSGVELLGPLERRP